MRIEDIEGPTKDLEARAKRRLALVQSPLDTHSLASGETTALTDADNLQLLLEAQLLLTTAAGREDARVARRDFWMEMFVIILISVEIALSAVAMRRSSAEGIAQSRVLSNIESSTKDTAKIIADVRTSQEAAVERLKDLHKAMNASAKSTAMLSTQTQRQLDILESEQNKKRLQSIRQTKLGEFHIEFLTIKTMLCTPVMIGLPFSGAATTKEACDKRYADWRNEVNDYLCSPGFYNPDCAAFHWAKTDELKDDALVRIMERLGP